MSLTALKQSYFGPAPAYDALTEITYLIEGRRYLGEIANEIEKATAGDRVYLLAWFFDPTLDLHCRAPGDPGYTQIGDLLAEKAALGVDVRLILNGAQYLGALGAPGYSTCYDAMNDLIARVPPGSTSPPLAGRVLYDWSGAEMTGSQHQKAVAVVRGGVLTAFAGGIDVNPLMLDDTPHNAQALPGTSPPVSWGWHDGGVKLVGGAAAGIYANFVDRWVEAATLPESRLWVRNPTGRLPRLVTYKPPTTAPVPPAPQAPAAAPTPQTSAQILRSRFKTKLNRPWQRLAWTTAGGGELTEVHATLAKAIDNAQEYIYIEDQFLADHPTLPNLLHKIVWWLADWIIGRGRLRNFSLLPHLEAALRRNVKVILVGSGYADPGDLIPGPKNRSLNVELKKLATANPAALAVWRLEEVTVHTKLTIMDDRFAAIGSANMQSRSMLGVDSEIHVAVVDDGSLVQSLRTRLWGEHLGINYSTAPATVQTALEDLPTALGMWRRGWGPGGEVWFAANNPVGFTPAALAPGAPRTTVVRGYVGPGTTP